MRAAYGGTERVVATLGEELVRLGHDVTLLRRRLGTRQIPVILWSGAIDSLEARAPALLPEHDIFVLPKPFDLNMLLQTIAAALAGGSLGQIAD